jgi:hypothetical protein
MKRLLLTMVVLLTSLPALFAQDSRSIIKVRLTDNSPITVAIDNRHFNEANRVLTVNNLPPGRHRIKVFLVNPNPTISARRTVYDGYVRVSPGTFNYIVVDRFKGTVRINTARRSEVETHDAYDPIDRSRYPQQGARDRNDRFPENNAGKNGSYNNDDRYDRDDIYDRSDKAYDYNRNDRDKGYIDGRAGSKDNEYYDDRSGTGNQLSQRDIDDLRTRVASRITDTDKLKLMQSALAGKSFTTEQIREMLGWLSFDSSKLDFARWAYTNVSDRRNFWRLEDVFSFGSSKEEFNSIINSRR